MTIEEEQEFFYLRYFFEHREKKMPFHEAGNDLEGKYEMAGGGLSVIGDLSSKRYLDQHYDPVTSQRFVWITEAGKSRYRILRRRKIEKWGQGWGTFILALIAAVFPICMAFKDGCSKRVEVKTIQSHAPVKKVVYDKSK